MHESCINGTGRSTVKVGWTKRTEGDMVAKLTRLNAINYVEKQALSRPQGLINLPAMTSLVNNATHHPLWTEHRQG